MSDPSSINSALNSRIDNNARNSPERQSNASLVDIPEKLKDNERTQRVRGKLTRIERDGTATIRTERGDIKAKIDAQTKIESGDAVEIRIDRGNPPQTAYIKPAADAPPPPQLTTPQTNVTIAPPVSVDTLINGAPIQITPTPAPQIPNLTQPYIEVINNNSIITTDLISHSATIEPTTLNLNDIQSVTTANIPTAHTEQTISIAPLAPVAPSVIKGDVISAVLTPPPQTDNVPFRIIAAQIIAPPLQEPITTEPKTPITQTVISDIQIQGINPPPALIIDPITTNQSQTPIRHGASTDARAGDTRSILVGYTPDKNLPVIEIITQQSEARPLHYTLQSPIIRADIPIGSEIELNVLSTTLQNSAPPVQPLMSAQLPVLNTAYFLTPQAWPVMQDIQQSLINTAPQSAQAMNAVMPNAATPQQLGNAVMFFVAAMRSGDMQGWLGDRAGDALKKAGKGDLISRLGREMSGLLKLNSEPISQDWRALSVPLGWQNEVHKMVLYYRKEDQGGGSDDAIKGTKTRFIMNLNLSKMGKVQLDALFIGQSQGIGRLDLVLRTENNFSGAMKQQMREGYINALQETQITGELSFQGALNSWVHITPDSAQEYEADI